MSKYTTGELAKLCGVSVRTVQYYDERGVLVPSELSEGGRRLYSEDDLKRMRVICFLREAGISINSIAEILSEEAPDKVISILLDRQECALHDEISALKDKLALIEGIKKELKNIDKFSVESIGDIAVILKMKNKLKRMRALMVITGIPATALQWVSIILWITKGIWWSFALWAVVAAVWGTLVSVYYFKRVAYICPECHTVFKPRVKEAFFANHTPTLRKLTCTCCAHKGFCVEIYQKEEKKNE